MPLFRAEQQSSPALLALVGAELVLDGDDPQALASSAGEQHRHQTRITCMNVD